MCVFPIYFLRADGDNPAKKKSKRQGIFSAEVPRDRLCRFRFFRQKNREELLQNRGLWGIIKRENLGAFL